MDSRTYRPLSLGITNGNFTLATLNASAAGNTVNYSDPNPQNIKLPADGSYSNLTISGGGANIKTLVGATNVGATLLIAASTTLASANNNLFVGKNFTNNGSFTQGTGTVTMNGSTAQQIDGSTTTAFNNLTVSNSSAIVTGATNFSVGNTLSVGANAILSPNAAVIVSGAGTLTGTGTVRVTRIAATPDFVSQYTIAGKTLAGLTVDYIGAGNQNVNALNYGSLTVSTNGSRTVTFPAAVVGVSNVFTPSSITTTYVITGNTITFNGTIAQSIPAFTYNNLISAGSSAKTLSGNIIVNNDLTITSNLDVSASNYSISVKRNWINNGTFNAQNGAVAFDGAVAQTLSGTGTTTFNQMDINNSSGGVQLSSGGYVLNNVINPLNGNFNTNGQSFTMISTATQTARIGQKATAASLSGNFIIQRYISGRDTSFCDLSSTVQTATINDWDNELPALSYIHTPPSALASAFTYNETLDTFLAITNSSTGLTPGKGYEVFLAGDYSYASLLNTTMDLVGVPNQGTQNLSGLISNNGQGWNLVGNPFASNISWASVYAASGSAGSGLYDFIEMYDYTIGDWSGYTSGDGIEIGSSQGFWVYGLPGASSLTLTIPESAKTTTSNSALKATTLASSSNFTLKISSNQNSFSHTFYLNASEDATNGLDTKYLPFRASPNKATPALYAFVDGKAINRNTFNSVSEYYDLALQTKASISGIYKIDAASFDFVDQYSCIQLEDKLAHTLINLRDQKSYSFELNPMDSPNRFVVHFSKSNECRQSFSSPVERVDFSDNVEVLSTPEGTTVNFSFDETTLVNIEIVNVLGQTIVSSKTYNVTYSNEIITLPVDYSGLYIVKVESEKGRVVKRFFKR